MDILEYFNKIDTLNNTSYDKYISIQDPMIKTQVLQILKNIAKKNNIDVQEFEKNLRKYEKDKNRQLKEKKQRNTLIDKHNIVANALIADNNNKFYLLDGNLCYYDERKKVYTINRDNLYWKINACNEEATEKFRKEVYEYLKVSLYPLKENHKNSIDINYINFKNGLYDLENDCIIPHTNDVFTLNQLNVNYYMECGTTPPKEAENVEKFLNDISCNREERKKAILEMIGYCLTSRTNLQKAFILYGSGANGKSTLTDLIQEIIGINNVSTVSIKDVFDDKFASSDIRYKLVNISEEMSIKNFDDSANFKNIVTTGRIRSQKKYQDSAETQNYAKFINNVNDMPKIADTSIGFLRRWHVIPFEAEFTQQEKMAFDKRTLFSEYAKAYLVYIALQAYNDMIYHCRGFSGELESNIMMTEYKAKNDSIYSYITDCDSGLNIFLEVKGYKKICTINRCDLQADYERFCENNKYKSVKPHDFYERLQNKPYNRFCILKKIQGTRSITIDIEAFKKYLEESSTQL